MFSDEGARYRWEGDKEVRVDEDLVEGWFTEPFGRHKGASVSEMQKRGR